MPDITHIIRTFRTITVVPKYCRSISLRKDAGNTLEKNDKMMKSALKSVNDGLMQKLAETVTLKVELSLK